MTKKTKISLFIILAILIIGSILTYYILSEGKPVTLKKKTEIKKETAISLPDETAEKLFQITDENIISPVVNEQKNTIKYITKTDGSLYQSNLDGKDKVKIPFVSLGGLIKIIWSPDQGKFINIYSDAFGVKRFYYDLASKQTLPLNKNITWVDYSKTEEKIAYHYYDATQNINSIAIANADGTLAKSILNTRLKDVRLQWVTDDKIIISTAPSGLAQNILYYINPEKPKLIKVLSGIYGLTSEWSYDGSKFIFSQTNKDGANLTLRSADSSGVNVLNTKIATLPEKCVFSKDSLSVYCAEPTELPKNIIMPDDYYKKTFSSNDRLWKIDLETNKKDLVYQFGENINFDLSDLILTKDEKYLYFINRTNGFLYRLEL